MLSPRQFTAIAVATIALLGLAAPGWSGEPPVMLELGDNAPEIKGVTEAGKTFRLSDRICERYTVVYFYPGDFTGGCRKQAMSFQSNMKKLTNLGVAVVGISGDTVETHRLFKKLMGLEYTLLADTEGAIAKSYGVPVKLGVRRVRAKKADGKPYWPDPELRRSKILERPATISRWTFIVAPDGRIIYKNDKVNPMKDSGQVLKIISELNKRS